jgi:6-phosphogluconolactonase
MADRGELHVYPDPEALARATADHFLRIGCDAITERGNFRVALAGGNTPKAAYELLAREPRASEISWSEVFIYFGDERCVPPTDERSNFHMAQRAFLNAVPIPPANVHRMAGEIDPGIAANEYASLIRSDLREPPHFDLVMLGLGPDGHTASLFPGSPPDLDDASLVRAVYAESQGMWRITITPLVINSARNVLFGIEGNDKAEILAKVYEGPRDPAKYPAQVVRPKSGNLVWLVDEAAAGMLHEKSH